MTSRPGRSRLVVVTLLALVGAALLGYRHTRGVAATLAADAAHEGGARTGLYLSWPRGTAYRYQVEWSTSAQPTALGLRAAHDRPPATLHADVDLLVRSYGRVGDATLLALSLPTVRTLDLALAPDRRSDAERVRTLVQAGGELFAGVDARGRLLWLRAAPGTPALVRDLVRSLALETQVVLPEAPAAAWTTTQLVAAGEVDLGYRADGNRVSRTRARYRRVLAAPGADLGTSTGVAAIVVTRGHLESLAEDEQLTASVHAGVLLTAANRLRVTLRGEERFDAAAGPTPDAVAALAEIAIDPTQRSAAEEAAMLAERVGGLTFEDLTGNLGAFGHAPHDPGRNAWVWKATGLLLQRPELCARLVPIFEAAGADAEVRSLVMDLLASAGSPTAQATMRRILASPTLTRPEERVALVQRFALVAEPDAESMTFLLDAYQDAKTAATAPGGSGLSDEMGASAYALGAATHQLARRDPAAAQAYADRLADEVDAAASPEARQAALVALGNAGDEDSVARVKPYAQDPDARVRAGAARALRRVDREDSVATLLQLAADPDAAVQREAIAALAEQLLSGATLAALAELVQSGRVFPSADAELVQLAAARLGGGAAVRVILETVRDRPGPATAAKRMAVGLLAQLG